MMKKTIIMTLGAALLMMTFSSCREETDKLMTYDHNDMMAFSKADTCFAEKFKIMWNGLNQYYALWDYEDEYGLDWDAVYDEYLPQFEALDKKETVTDEELKELMGKVCSPLHDGHLAVVFSNHTTGTEEVMYLPSEDRVVKHDDYEIAMKYQSSLKYYSQVANGEVETDSNGNPIVLQHSTSITGLIGSVLKEKGKGLDWVSTQIEQLSTLPNPTAAQTLRLDSLKTLEEELSAIKMNFSLDVVSRYNELVTLYASLHVPGLEYFDPGFTDKGIDVKFALLKGNIAYFQFSGFYLTAYLVDEAAKLLFDVSNPITQNHIKAIEEVWTAWFNTVQQLHKAGTLGGVIIDLRGNGGGMQADGYYVTGSLLPEGGSPFSYSRFKRGTGRYDYSTLTLNYLKTMEADKHEVITEPVVVMTNCHSLSMAEITTIVVRSMENGTHIGKRSKGGICGLTSDNSTFTNNYMGHIGERHVTPVYVYLPSVAAFTLDHKIIEGEGITPDIEVDLNEAEFVSTGKDSQLDRALQFLRTGN
ncbi:MAG: hypothetical protein IKR31_04675 [Prevotella sp.]|nr:hypothetical protein [Prevotella sp.]